MTKLRWNKRTERWEPKPDPDYSRPLGVMMVRDIEPYRSPMGSGWITSRSHRREDLARHGCREVDPSEKLTMQRYREPDILEQTAKMDAEIDPQGAAMINNPNAVKRGSGLLDN